ncbi:MAG: CBS domain-containing protein [Thiohalomonadales bacterium]
MSDKKIVRVCEVMKTDFDVVDGMSTIHNALSTMKYIDTKCLIVHKRHDDDEFGILLISDIARKVLAKDRSFDRVNVYEVMTKPVLCVEKDMDIRYCARMFDRFDISRAPVVDNGEIIGVVSLTDLILRGLYTN